MPSIEARIPTGRAGRYLAQLCQHAEAMGGAGGHRPRPHRDRSAHQDTHARAEWSDTHGVITFTPGGKCTVDADAGTLTVRIDAADDQALQRIQDIVGRDLDRFSGREPLTVTWRRPGSTGEPAVP
jgi:hypothetical protein